MHRSIYEQRLQVDDRGIDLLLQLARRVNSRAEEDPDILVRWKPVLDFVATFRPGRTPKPAKPT